MTDNTYNGWTNWETWVVNLWITNSESTYLALRRLSRNHNGNIPEDAAKEFVRALYGENYGGFPEDDLDADAIDWEDLIDNWNQYAYDE